MEVVWSQQHLYQDLYILILSMQNHIDFLEEMCALFLKRLELVITYTYKQEVNFPFQLLTAVFFGDRSFPVEVKFPSST